jgi:hypothetical protein
MIPESGHLVQFFTNWGEERGGDSAIQGGDSQAGIRLKKFALEKQFETNGALVHQEQSGISW